MILEPSLKENKMVELPPLSLYSMTKPQLEKFIPRLIDLSCNDSAQRQPMLTAYSKPEWWPVNVPWAAPAREDGENMYKQLIGGGFESTDKLRSVVQACYEYMGHTDLLNLSNMDANMTGLSLDVDVLSIHSSSDESEGEVVDVYVCFYCDKWFGGKSGKSQLEEHVLKHMEPTKPQSAGQVTNTGSRISGHQISGCPTSGPQISGRPTSAPQISGRQTSAPQISGRQTSAPQISGRQTSAPQISGRQTSAPQISGRQTSAPQISGRQTANPQITGHWNNITPKLERPDAISISTATDTATSVHAGFQNLATRPTAKPFQPRKPPRRRPDIPVWKRTDLPCKNGVKQSDFLKAFGMISSKQAETESAKTKVDLDIDCEIVAVEGLDSRPLPSPRTPRTLMSQMSRDGESNFKKRLSFSVPDDGSDGECSETSSSCSSSATTIQGALLNVPLSSLLGKRVQKHMKPDGSACTIKDPEQYCSTVVRNDFLVKLRFRPPDYPITYKRKRKHCAKYCHEYKFNKEQRREFDKCIRTGLNKESRQLRKRMKPCAVLLKRVSTEEIDFWKEKRRYHGAEWIDDDISIVQIEPGVSDAHRLMNNVNNSNNIVVANQIQARTMQQQQYRPTPTILQNHYPQLSAQMFGGSSRPTTVAAALSSQPMPQFLVKKLEKQFNGHQSCKLVYVPISELQAEPQKRIESRSKPRPGNQVPRTAAATVARRPLGPASSSRRKQHFANVRRDLDLDDDVSVHSSQSSSDEEYEKRRLNDRVAASCGHNAASPVNHMVMSASDGHISMNVASKTAKMFGSTAPVNTAPQCQRHFTSHPGQQKNPPNMLVKRQSVFSGGATTRVCPTLTDGCQNNVTVDSLSHSTVDIGGEQHPLHVVGDIIYIDDD